MRLTKSKTILVCPLDWGLGHATRLVPIIDLLIKKGARVILGADNRPLAYLKLRFPNCEFIKFPGFQPTYPKSGSMAFAMVKSFPKMQREAIKANEYLQQLIIEKKIDVVISDNRYELYSQKAYAVFISHQLNIKTPGITSLAKPIIQDIIYKYIKKYDELWIPDFEELPNLSGELSHIKKMPITNHYFIGPLSRFSLLEEKKVSKNIDLLILLSGPEPQRTILEKQLIEQALESRYSTVVLQGRPETNEERSVANVHIIPHADDKKIAELIRSAKHIICRPGYSTIMDLVVLGKKAVFIPTPGQTEQEYLANRLMQDGIFYSDKQHDFKIQNAVLYESQYMIPFETHHNDILETRIDVLLGHLSADKLIQ